MCRTALLDRLSTSRDGGMGLVLALFLSFCIPISALAVDVGSLFLERRTVQGAADLAAMAAAGDIDQAEATAKATLSANGFGEIRSMVVVKGHYEADPAMNHEARFEAGKVPYNAVRLDVALGGRLYFAKSFMAEPEISVSAIGTTASMATFSVGSRLASVHDGIANALLGALLGGNVSLSVMDYRALLDAHVSVGGLLSALATGLGVTAGTYGELLDADARVGTVLSAAARASSASGQASAASVLVRLAQSAGSVKLPLSDLLDLGPLGFTEVGGAHPGLGADVNVMSLVSTAASLANGNNQVSVNLGAAVPGLLSLRLDLAIGEPAKHSGWVAVGQEGSNLRTAQTRLKLVAEIGGSGVLSGLRIRLPLYVEVASAEARLKTLSCRAAGNGSAVVEAKPAVVRAWIGDVATLGLASFGSSALVSPGVLVDTSLIDVTAMAYAEASNSSAVDLSFSQADIDARAIKTAEVHDLASSLVASLLRSADLDVGLIGLGSISAIKTLVASLLAPVAGTLDGVLRSLLGVLGVHLGEVDVGVNGIRCGAAALAG